MLSSRRWSRRTISSGDSVIPAKAGIHATIRSIDGQWRGCPPHAVFDMTGMTSSAGVTSGLELAMDNKTEQTDVATAEPTPVSAAPAPGSSIPPEELEQLTADIVAALKTVYDPEIPSDIYELGLIYKIDVDDARNVAIEMTLTAPGCPVAGEMPTWVENAVASVAGVGQVSVKLTFDPPWDKDRMSDEAKLALGMF